MISVLTLMLLVLLAAGLLLALAETWQPIRLRRWPRRQRWPVHAVLGLLLLAAAAVLLLGHAAIRGSVPGWLARTLGGMPAFLLTLLLLDLALYGLHRVVHRSPLLWRLHRVHHSDADPDCSTGLRVHPLEGALFLAGLLLAALLLQASTAVLTVYLLLLGLASLGTHANLAPALEPLLGGLLVTPRLHRRHHLRDALARDHNYGLVFSLWDRAFDTYRAPRGRLGGERALGLDEVGYGPDLGLRRLLWLPLERPPPAPRLGPSAGAPAGPAAGSGEAAP